MNIADMSIQTYHAESAMLRLIKLIETKDQDAVSIEEDIVRCYLNDADDKVNKAGKDAINSFAEGDEQRMMLLGLKRFTKIAPFNTKDARRRIAKVALEQNKYPL